MANIKVGPFMNEGAVDEARLLISTQNGMINNFNPEANYVSPKIIKRIEASPLVQQTQKSLSYFLTLCNRWSILRILANIMTIQSMIILEFRKSRIELQR